MCPKLLSSLFVPFFLPPQSAGSDTQVVLWRADALSSAAPHLNAAEVTAPVPSGASGDAQVCVYDEHEDSVYSVVRAGLAP